MKNHDTDAMILAYLAKGGTVSICPTRTVAPSKQRRVISRWSKDYVDPTKGTSTLAQELCDPDGDAPIYDLPEGKAEVEAVQALFKA